MKRIALLATVVALVTGLAATAQAAPPPVDVWPNIGEAGTVTWVQVWGMTPGSDFEVHGESLTGPLLGSGTTDAYGYGSVYIEIPSGAAEGAYAIEICEVSFVACTDTTSDFWVGRSSVFTVELPLPTAIRTPDIRLEPATGEAGTTTRVFVSGFTPEAQFEVHGGDYGAGIIAGDVPRLDADGAADFYIQIPAGAGEGTFTVAVCEVTYVGCIDTWSDFWVGASAGFTVVVPPPPPSPPTTIAAPPTTEAAPPTTEAASDIPEATTTTTALATTTTTGETEVTTTTSAPVVGEGPVALPQFEDTTESSGSILWWLIILAVIGAGALGLLVGRRLHPEE